MGKTISPALDARPRVLAVASGGGHWIQMQRLRSAFRGSQLAFACADARHRDDAGDAPFFLLPDANRKTPLRTLALLWRSMRLVATYRPEVVISTGAAPGAIAVVWGKCFGARTIWVDSLANVQRLSVSGRLVRRFCDVWLTQWPHLAKDDGPNFRGSLL